MKKNRLIASLIAVVLGASVTAGCSRDNTSDTNAGNNVTESMGIEGSGSGGNNQTAATSDTSGATANNPSLSGNAGTSGNAGNSAAGGQATGTPNTLDNAGTLGGSQSGSAGNPGAAGGAGQSVVPGDHDHAATGRVEASQNGGKAVQGSKSQNKTRAGTHSDHSAAGSTSGTSGSSSTGGSGQTSSKRPAGEPHGMGLSPGMETIGDGPAPGGINQTRR